MSAEAGASGDRVLASSFDVRVEQLVSCVCVCVCISVYLFARSFSSEMTFDLDIWNGVFISTI